MGMYTEFHFNAALKDNAPNSVIEILEFMLGDSAERPELPAHLLFQSDRWEWMLRCDSYYFDADTHSTLKYDEVSKQYYLCIRCNLKNYNDEIEKFILWIMPYLDKHPGDFLGFSRYEETEKPTLIFMERQGQGSGEEA